MSTLLKLIFDLFYGLLAFLFDMVAELLRLKPKKKTVFDADFISGNEILSSSNHGFNLTGRKALSTKDSFQNAMILGGSGSGKTSKILIPSIYQIAEGGNSMCIHDPSGELYEKTGHFLTENGYNIKVIHYAKPEISDGYNPFHRIRSQSDIQKVASMLVQNSLGNSTNDTFWNNSAISLLTVVISVLKKQHHTLCNPYNAKYLIDQFLTNTEGWDMLIAECNDRKILEQYKALLMTEKKVLQNVISTVRAAMNLFDDPSIQQITSFDTVSFSEIRQRKTAIFIQNRTADLKYYAPLTSIFFEQLFSEIMSEFPKPGDKHVFMLIDECSELRLPGLQSAFSNIRKYSAGICICLQYFGQLKSQYDVHQAESIRANSYGVVYLPNQPLDTCRELSTLLGTFEYLDDEDREKTRALMLPDEIRTIPEDRAIILCGRHRAIYARMVPYFKRTRFRKYSELAPPALENKLPYDELPLLVLAKKPKEVKYDTK